MSRYQRVNLDGKSVTETRITAAALLPGTFATIVSDEFTAASAISGRMYVMNPAYHQGLDIDQTIPLGDSGVGEYVEDDRELAIRVPAGTYAKDTPITLGTAGKGAIGTEGTDVILGYSQDEVTLTEEDVIRVRFRYVAVS